MRNSIFAERQKAVFPSRSRNVDSEARRARAKATQIRAVAAPAPGRSTNRTVAGASSTQQRPAIASAARTEKCSAGEGGSQKQGTTECRSNHAPSKRQAHTSSAAPNGSLDPLAARVRGVVQERNG